MPKIKLFAVAAFILLTAAVLSSSSRFAASANEDVVREIASYKTWRRINKEPIMVRSAPQNGGANSSEDTFIIDGQEVSNFRTGELNG